MFFAAFILRLARAILSSCNRSPYFRVILLLVLSTSVCLVLIGRDMHTAFAVQAKPPTDWSFYMTTTDSSKAYTLGCNQGHFDAGFSPPANSEVILDFGGQNSSGTGTLMTNGIPITNAQIETAAEQFSRAYYICTGSDTASVLKLGIGTNNSYYNVSSSGGSIWGQVVATVRAYNQYYGYDAQVYAGGADDMEPAWNSASATHAWADGYASVSNSAFYLNYGSADGCPWTSSGNGSCNNGWHQYDVWYVSWGSLPAYPVPEIYYSVNAQQWAMISLYGAQYQGGRVYMQGPMDEYDLNTSTDTASASWNQLWIDLNNNSSTVQSMYYSVEIHRES